MFRYNRQVFHLCKRTIHLTRTVCDKIFKESENEYAHRILAVSGVQTLYQPLQSTVDPKLPENDVFTTLTNPELFQIFEGVANYCRIKNLPISDTRFDPLIDELVSRRANYDFDDLAHLLKILATFPETPSKNTRNHCDIWTAVEEVALEKMPTWSTDLKLKLADLFYQLNLARTTRYTFRAACRIGNKADNIAKEKLLHLVFLINLSRKPLDSMIDIERNLLKIFDELTVDEIAVVCMSFFKTQSAIRSQVLVHKMYKLLKDNLDHVHDITMVNILKVLRYSSGIKEQHLMIELLDAITPHIPRFNLLSCLHICLLGTDIQQCHKPSLQIILNRFVNEIKSARMKDIERIMFVLGIYDYETPEFTKKHLCEVVMQELYLRTDEIVQHPKTLPQTLSYLALNGVHLPLDLVSCTLNPHFIKRAYGSNYFKYGRELIMMDSYVELFYRDEYKGNRMRKNHKDYLCNMSVDYLPERNGKYKLTKSSLLLLEMHEACEEVTGNAKMCHPLPHFQRPDVVMAVNKHTKQAIPLNFPQKQGSTLLTRDLLLKGVGQSQDIKLIAVVIGGWNLYVRHTKKPTGLLKNKVRHLEQAGYEVITVHWEDWPGSQMAQAAFIKQELEKALVK